MIPEAIKHNRDEVVGQLHAVMGKYSPMGDDVNRSIDKVGIPSNHYTPSRLFSIEELPLALAYIILHDGDLLEAVKDGVSSGRDTDSIGVMARCHILVLCKALQLFRKLKLL